MPLHVYQRDSSGQIIYAKGSAGYDVAQSQEVDLPDEMTAIDFEPIRCDWLYLTFEERSLWHDETPECLQMIAHVASFLTEKTVGPYYVHEGDHNNRQTYGVVLLDQRDVAAFAEAFPDWKFDDKSHQQNTRILHQALQGKWQPQSPRLQRYCFEQGLCRGTAPAPSAPK